MKCGEAIKICQNTVCFRVDFYYLCPWKSLQFEKGCGTLEKLLTEFSSFPTMYYYGFSYCSNTYF